MQPRVVLALRVQLLSTGGAMCAALSGVGSVQAAPIDRLRYVRGHEWCWCCGNGPNPVSLSVGLCEPYVDVMLLPGRVGDGRARRLYCS